MTGAPMTRAEQLAADYKAHEEYLQRREAQRNGTAQPPDPGESSKVLAARLFDPNRTTASPAVPPISESTRVLVDRALAYSGEGPLDPSDPMARALRGMNAGLRPEPEPEPEPPKTFKLRAPLPPPDFSEFDRYAEEFDGE